MAQAKQESHENEFLLRSHLAMIWNAKMAWSWSGRKSASVSKKISFSYVGFLQRSGLQNKYGKHTTELKTIT